MDKFRSNTNYRREYMAHFMRVRFWERKVAAVRYKGGKCQSCGYNKHYEGLVFHHRNPAEKEYCWDSLKRMNWNSVLKELDKCDCLCHNCHTETHVKMKDDILNSQQWLASHRQPKRTIKIHRSCVGCRIAIYSRSRYCSSACFNRQQCRLKLTDEELIKAVETSSQLKVAKLFGISDSAVRKHYKRAKKRLCPGSDLHRDHQL